MKYRSYALVAIGIMIVAALSLGAFWFARSNGGSKGDEGSVASSPSSSNRFTTTANGAASGITLEYDYSEAPDHIGERATVRARS